MRKPNPALVGTFLLGALALAVAGLLVFGGGKYFKSQQLWQARFDESVKGLVVGAPVTFRGVPVGSVTDIKVVVDPGTHQVYTLVVFAITPDRLTTPQGGAVAPLMRDRRYGPALFARGLRAQLDIQSLLTGQLFINLDFFAGAPPPPPVDAAAALPEFPTIPSTKQAILQALEKVDIAGLATDLRGTLRGVSQLVNGPEVHTVLAAANTTLQAFTALAHHTSHRLDELTPLVQDVAAHLTQALQAVQALAHHIDGQVVPAVADTFTHVDQVAQQANTETLPALTQTLGDARATLRGIAQAAGPLRAALEQAQRTLATVESAVEDRSPLQYDLRAALQDVAAAARAVRVLAIYLERHPNAVLFGKSAGGE
jgi:paraquat-inducible protein B